MTWTVIARQDARSTVGTRSTKLLLGVLAAAVLLMAYLYPVLSQDPITTARFPGYVQGTLTTVVPFVGLMLGYNAVASERESGALLLRLSLPASREDVVLGAYASRTGLVVGMLLASLLGAGALVVYPFGELEILPYAVFLVLATLFAAVWSGIAVAVSLAASTKRRALVAGFALLVVLVFVWDTLARALTLGLNAAGVVDGELPDPLAFLFGIDPASLFDRAITGFVTPSASVEGAWYLNEWVALVLLVAWVVGPVGLAARWFAGRDLS